MPIFDFKCNSCGAIFESFKNSIEDETKEECECGGFGVRVSHFENQNLKRPDYIPPPKATRKFGEEKISPHVRKRWE